MSPLVTVAGSIILVIGTVGGAWISATAATNKELQNTTLEQQKTDSRQDLSIKLVQQSACIQNSNMANLTAVLKASFVPDPSCK